MANNKSIMMKRQMKYLIPLTFVTCFSITQCACAQIQELQQLMLNIEKLTQLKSILHDMQTGYQIYQQGYSNISGLSKGNFDLHNTYLNGLLSINPTVRNYSRVAEIISEQGDIISEYKSASKKFKMSGSFNISELNYINSVYAGLVRESFQDLDELADLLTTGKLRMSDDERLRYIDRIYASSSDKLQFLRHFNRQGMLLTLQRTKDAADIKTVRQLHGVNN